MEHGTFPATPGTADDNEALRPVGQPVGQRFPRFVTLLLNAASGGRIGFAARIEAQSAQSFASEPSQQFVAVQVETMLDLGFDEKGSKWIEYEERETAEEDSEEGENDARVRG